MKRAWAVTTLFVMLAALTMRAQTTSAITVTNSQVSNGVVVVAIEKSGKTFNLQCNQGMSACTVLKKGDYTMVQLPENWGMYDCKDVEVYPQSAGSEPAKSTKLGEYCLIAPK